MQSEGGLLKASYVWLRILDYVDDHFLANVPVQEVPVLHTSFQRASRSIRHDEFKTLNVNLFPQRALFRVSVRIKC